MQNYSKKAQVGMLELLMVMVIIGIIIAIGIYFYYTAFLKDVKEKGNKLSIQEQEVLLGMAGKLPEIQCSIDTRTENCIDTSKLASAKDVISLNKKYYTDMLGFNSISVELEYPDKNKNECTENNYPDCGIFKIYENKPKNLEKSIKASVLISLYYPGDKSYKVGRLVLEAYR